MDPISHAIIGGALSLVNGGEISSSNPFLLASMLGAVSPDFDIVYRLKGEVKYLKEHRGFSHSIPGLVILSAGISAVLSLIYPAAALQELFLWAFVGGLSHTFFDYLNSYGVEIFGPLSKKKFTINLVQIADPVILMLFGMSFVFAHFNVNAHVLYVCVLVYLMLRLYMKSMLKRRVTAYYSGLGKVVVLPSLLGIFNWDYICFMEEEIKIGKVNFWEQPKPWADLKNSIDDGLRSTVLNSDIGKFFSKFSPYVFMARIKEGEKIIVKIFDIRYYTKGRFLHSATYFVEWGEVVSGLFHPFTERKKYII